jgi:hypothetical protein
MKSKLTFTALAVALLLSVQAQAQVPVVSKVAKALPKVTLGLKAGANFQTLSGSTWASTYKPGILGGAFVGVYKGKWGVQAEALIKSARFDLTGSGNNGYVKSVSLDVPVLAEYKVIKRVWIQAGPQFSSLLSAKNNNSTDVKQYFKSSDISGVLGVEVKLPVHLVAGARYVLGFTDVNNHYAPVGATAATDAWKNRYAQLYVGFRFL